MAAVRAGGRDGWGCGADGFKKFLKQRGGPYHERMCDFHALVYVAKFFDIGVWRCRGLSLTRRAHAPRSRAAQTAAAMAEHVRDGTPFNEGLTMILDSMP